MEITVHIDPVDVITSIELNSEELDELDFKEGELNDYNEGDKFIWERTSTLLFLNEYRKRIDKFRDPKTKKKTLWGDIQKVMNDEGYLVDSDALDRKMRNMKCTFNKIKENNKRRRTGRKIHWEYYSVFSEMFAEDKTVDAQHVTLSVPAMEHLTLDISDELFELSSSDLSPTSFETTTSLASGIERLEIFRKRKIEFEENKLEELKKIRMTVEACNKVNRDKLKLFKQYVNKHRK